MPSYIPKKKNTIYIALFLSKNLKKADIIPLNKVLKKSIAKFGSTLSQNYKIIDDLLPLYPEYKRNGLNIHKKTYQQEQKTYLKIKEVYIISDMVTLEDTNGKKYDLDFNHNTNILLNNVVNLFDDESKLEIARRLKVYLCAYNSA